MSTFETVSSNTKQKIMLARYQISYSRNTQSWIELGSLTVNCLCAGAASLQDGKVMLIGGLSGSEVGVAQETMSVLLISLQSNSSNV